MIKIEFELQDKENIIIFGIDERGKRQEIGHIFTPGGSGKKHSNAIQICGFDEAFDLWGCGVYGDKATKNMKRDIQVTWHGLYDQMDNKQIEKVIVEEIKHPLKPEQQESLGLPDPFYIEKVTKNRFDISGEICGKCFNHPCNCEVKIAHENPFTVKREQDLWLYSREEYEKAMKNTLLNELEK